MSDEVKPEEIALTLVSADDTLMGAPENDEEEAITFPIIHMKKGTKLPESGMYVVVGSNGIFVHNNNKVGRSLVRIEGISFLEPVQSFIMPKMPKLPARIISQALTFFRQVYDRYQSESGVVLFYSESKKDFILWCPSQEVSHGSCKYDRNDSGQTEPELEGYNIVGSIHSHADFGAFHSGTDVHDEIDYDGLHITIGNVNTPTFSICASLAVAKDREKVEPEYCAKGLGRDAVEESRWVSFSKPMYRLELSPDEQEVALEDAQMIRKHWLPKVSKLSYGFGWGGAGKKKSTEVGAGDEYDELTGRWESADF